MKSYNGYEFSDELIVRDMRRLINQIWKLLPMRENNEDWQKQLDSVLVELYGLHKIFGDQLGFLELLSKLEGVVGTQEFMVYRVQIFNAISLLTELANTLDAHKS